MNKYMHTCNVFLCLCTIQAWSTSTIPPLSSRNIQSSLLTSVTLPLKPTLLSLSPPDRMDKWTEPNATKIDQCKMAPSLSLPLPSFTSLYSHFANNLPYNKHVYYYYYLSILCFYATACYSNYVEMMMTIWWHPKQCSSNAHLLRLYAFIFTHVTLFSIIFI